MKNLISFLLAALIMFVLMMVGGTTALILGTIVIGVGFMAMGRAGGIKQILGMGGQGGNKQFSM
jgi:hypothetical protein